MLETVTVSELVPSTGSVREMEPGATTMAGGSASEIVNGCGLTLKKMLPTARTMIRASLVSTAGRVIVCEPSLGVAAARTVSNVSPSVASRMSTVGVLIVPPSVPATFHVTAVLPDA